MLDYGVGRDSTLHLLLRLCGGECSARIGIQPKSEMNSAELGPRGLVGFGRKTDQEFKECFYEHDPMIRIKPFVIELRLVK